MKSPFRRRYVSGWGQGRGAARQRCQQGNHEGNGKEYLFYAEQGGGSEPLAVELATAWLGCCSLSIVGFGARRWDRQHLATQGLIELSQPYQRLGRTVEHQNADQQQESCRHALSQNHTSLTLLNGAYRIDQ